MSIAKDMMEIFPPDLHERRLNVDWIKEYGVGDWKVDWADYFQPQDRFAFSPLPSFPASFEGLALLMLIQKLDKPQLITLMRELMGNVTSILNNLVQAGKTNPYIGINNATMWACLAHRFGLIDNGARLKILDQTRTTMDILKNVGVIEGVATLVEAPVKGLGTLAKIASVKKT